MPSKMLGNLCHLLKNLLMMVCLDIIRFIEVKFELRIKVNGSGLQLQAK